MDYMAEVKRAKTKDELNALKTRAAKELLFPEFAEVSAEIDRRIMFETEEDKNRRYGI